MPGMILTDSPCGVSVSDRQDMIRESLIYQLLLRLLCTLDQWDVDIEDKEVEVNGVMESLSYYERLKLSGRINFSDIAQPDILE